MFLSSRMFTPGFKLFFGIALFLFGGTVLFGMSSSLLVEGTDIGDRLNQQGVVETVTGPFTAGWKGPVGNHAGYGLLLVATGLAAFLGLILIAFRDADPEAEAQLLEVETVPLTRAPSGTNFAPLIAAFSLALMAIGWVSGSFLLYAGITLLVVTAATWTVRAWAERATGDAEVNRQIYTRIIDPLRVPVVGVLLIGFLVVGLSRVLLAARRQLVPDRLRGRRRPPVRWRAGRGRRPPAGQAAGHDPDRAGGRRRAHRRHLGHRRRRTPHRAPRPRDRRRGCPHLAARRWRGSTDRGRPRMSLSSPIDPSAEETAR